MPLITVNCSLQKQTKNSYFFFFGDKDRGKYVNDVNAQGFHNLNAMIILSESCGSIF